MRTADNKKLIEYLLNEHGWTPLEIAKELGIRFRTVTSYMDKHGLSPRRYFVAVNVKKATQSDIYYPSNVIEFPGFGVK